RGENPEHRVAGPAIGGIISKHSCGHGARSRRPNSRGAVAWAPACAGVTVVVRDALPTGVIPVQAGTQDTERRGPAIGGIIPKHSCGHGARSRRSNSRGAVAWAPAFAGVTFAARGAPRRPLA